MGADHHDEHRRITDVRRGQSRAAVTATLAMSCLLAACGVEPRVDEVRVSITAPTLDGHRQLGALDTPSPHDADPDSVDVTTLHDEQPPEASDVAAIAAAEPTVSAEPGDAVVAAPSSAQLVSRPHDSLAPTGERSVLADDARGDDVPTDRAPDSEFVLTDTEGLASPGVDSGGAAASDRLDGAHSDSVDVTDDRPATA